MDPIIASMIIASIGIGANMFMQNKAADAQEAATESAANAAKNKQDVEGRRAAQIASNAAAANKKRSIMVNSRNNTAEAGAAGSTQIAGGLTPSNGGNAQAGNAGTF